MKDVVDRLLEDSDDVQERGADLDVDVDVGADRRDDQESDDVLEDVAATVADTWAEGRRWERREDARGALQWLRRTGGPAGQKDVVSALYADALTPRQNGRTWYRKTVRPAFNEARDRGLVEYDESERGYVWTGDE